MFWRSRCRISEGVDINLGIPGVWGKLRYAGNVIYLEEQYLNMSFFCFFSDRSRGGGEAEDAADVRFEVWGSTAST